eukprot:360432-Chlamydomonas_euryale.AAC.7
MQVPTFARCLPDLHRKRASARTGRDRRSRRPRVLVGRGGRAHGAASRRLPGYRAGGGRRPPARRRRARRGAGDRAAVCRGV